MQLVSALALHITVSREGCITVFTFFKSLRLYASINKTYTDVITTNDLATYPKCNFNCLFNWLFSTDMNCKTLQLPWNPPKRLWSAKPAQRLMAYVSSGLEKIVSRSSQATKITNIRREKMRKVCRQKRLHLRLFRHILSSTAVVIQKLIVSFHRLFRDGDVGGVLRFTDVTAEAYGVSPLITVTT